MIYLYDDKGKVTAEYEDWKRRDVDIDLRNGSLSGTVLVADDIRAYKYDGKAYITKTTEELFSAGLIDSKARDAKIAAVAAADKAEAIQAELLRIGEESLAAKRP